MVRISDILFDLCGNDFLLPYLRREASIAEGEPDYDKDTEPTRAVRIVTDDTTANTDPAFDAEVLRLGLPLAVLHCPCIVATGMTGLPRRIAESIYAGRFVTIKGCDARISVVHGSDAARAAMMMAGTVAILSLTDGTDPTIAGLADAIACRIDGKRLFAVGPRIARLWHGRQFYTMLTTDATCPENFSAAYPDFRPTPVTEYLRTHVYDQNSP